MRPRHLVRENPLSSGETAALVLGGVAVVGALAYAFWPKAAAAGAAGRTAAARDTYSVTLTAASGGTTAPSFDTLGSLVSGLSSATLSLVLPNGTGGATVIFTAPPQPVAAMQSAINTSAGALGFAAGPVTDTGVAVQ